MRVSRLLLASLLLAASCHQRVEALPVTVVEPPATSEPCAIPDLCRPAEAAKKDTERLRAECKASSSKACGELLDAYQNGEDDRDLFLAAGAISSNRLAGASGPLMALFSRIHIRWSDKPHRAVDTALHDAMVAVVDPSWEPQLLALVDSPFSDHLAFGGPIFSSDEQFRRCTAAALLGHMRSAGAARPLLKLMLTPRYCQTTARCALMRVGKPALAPAVAILKGEDREFVEHAKKYFVSDYYSLALGEPYASIVPAVDILGALGRDEAIAPLIGALGSADKRIRALIAIELTNLPRTPESVKAFQDVVDKTREHTEMPAVLPGDARLDLVDAAGRLHDPTLVPWLVKYLKGLTERDPQRRSLLLGRGFDVALLLATEKQMKSVDEVLKIKVQDPEGAPRELGEHLGSHHRAAKEVLAACKDKIDCYVAQLAAPAQQQVSRRFAMRKSAHMIAALGGAGASQKIADALPGITDDAAFFAALEAIDYLSPKGAPALTRPIRDLARRGIADYPIVIRLESRAR